MAAGAVFYTRKSHPDPLYRWTLAKPYDGPSLSHRGMVQYFCIFPRVAAS